jgi:hypothetical protein
VGERFDLPPDSQLAIFDGDIYNPKVMRYRTTNEPVAILKAERPLQRDMELSSTVQIIGEIGIGEVVETRLISV